MPSFSFVESVAASARQRSDWAMKGSLAWLRRLWLAGAGRTLVVAEYQALFVTSTDEISCPRAQLPSRHETMIEIRHVVAGWLVQNCECAHWRSRALVELERCALEEKLSSADKFFKVAEPLIMRNSAISADAMARELRIVGSVGGGPLNAMESAAAVS